MRVQIGPSNQVLILSLHILNRAQKIGVSRRFDKCELWLYSKDFTFNSERFIKILKVNRAELNSIKILA